METERILLRPWREDDAEVLCPNLEVGSGSSFVEHDMHSNNTIISIIYLFIYINFWGKDTNKKVIFVVLLRVFYIFATQNNEDNEEKTYIAGTLHVNGCHR